MPCGADCHIFDTEYIRQLEKRICVIFRCKERECLCKKTLQAILGRVSNSTKVVHKQNHSARPNIEADSLIGAPKEHLRSLQRSDTAWILALKHNILENLESLLVRLSFVASDRSC